jgi:hypothetical protein
MEEYRVPKVDLAPSLEVAKAIHEHAGTAAAEQIAAFLGYASSKNGAYLNRVASARLFGFVEGNSPTIKPTRLALKIIEPATDEEASKARLQAFLNVPLFNAFFQAHKGHPLPKKQGVDNLLKREYGIPEGQASFARARLLRSAEQAGLFKIKADRMLEPPHAGGAGDESPPPGDQGQMQPPPGDGHDEAFPTVIQAILEQVPWESDWTPEEFQDWSEFFTTAVRRHFKFRPPTKGAS